MDHYKIAAHVSGNAWDGHWMQEVQWDTQKATVGLCQQARQELNLQHNSDGEQLRELGQNGAQGGPSGFLQLPDRKMEPGGGRALLSRNKGQDKGKWPQAVPGEV